MRISPEAGTVKDGEEREVPLHAHLVELGFPKFAKSKPSGPLFYAPNAQRKADSDPTNPTRAPYVIARQKLAEWITSLGLKLPPSVRPTHAWRHTFVHRAKAMGMDRSYRFAMCGHEEGDVGDDYAPPELEDLAKVMEAFPRYELAVQGSLIEGCQ